MTLGAMDRAYLPKGHPDRRPETSSGDAIPMVGFVSATDVRAGMHDDLESDGGRVRWRQRCST